MSHYSNDNAIIIIAIIFLLACFGAVFLIFQCQCENMHTIELLTSYLSFNTIFVQYLYLGWNGSEEVQGSEGSRLRCRSGNAAAGAVRHAGTVRTGHQRDKRSVLLKATNKTKTLVFHTPLRVRLRYINC